MVLDEKQASEIKSKLLSQLSNLPESSREQIKSQVEKMNSAQLETFLEQNVKMDECLFCSIVEGKSPSYKIYEDDNFLAVLNIRPLSKGQVLILPKEHDFEIVDGENLQEIKKKIISALKNSSLKIEEASMKIEEMFGHSYVSILPVTKKDEIRGPLNFKEEEFKNLQSELKELIRQEGLEEIKENLEIVEKKELFKCGSRIP